MVGTRGGVGMGKVLHKGHRSTRSLLQPSALLGQLERGFGLWVEEVFLNKGVKDFSKSPKVLFP